MHRAGGICSQKCMIDTPRYATSELHVGKFPDTDDFQCWRVNIKTEVCESTSTPQLTMSWIIEVEMAGSIDDLVTSQSTKAESFPDFEMLDARIASKKRFLRGRQIAEMIVPHKTFHLHILAQHVVRAFLVVSCTDEHYFTVHSFHLHSSPTFNKTTNHTSIEVIFTRRL